MFNFDHVKQLYIQISLLCLITCAFNTYAIADEQEISEYDQYVTFYLEPRFEWEGHLWRPIYLQHHPECPCLNPIVE